MPLISDTLRNIASALIIAAIVIAGLVLGREILIPLTAAILITFVLTPVVSRLTRMGLPSAASIVLTVVATTILIGGLAVVVSNELLTLTANLPRYHTNIVQKVRTVTATSKADSAVSKATQAVEKLETEIRKELDSSKTTPSATNLPPKGESATAPPKVIVAAETRNSPFDIVEAAGKPVAQAALAFLFTLFLLFQYKDLRDRIVRVVGTDHMSDTTSAMSEAGERLSKFFLFQALLNSGYGIFVGVALWLIGVPSPALWGLVAALMRFVPYVGAIVAAIPPALLAAAVDPNWTMLALTLTIFLIGEPLTGHIIEPLVLGKKAGISPFAMVMAASFWTLVWGSVGLILAAPLTMVLVVVGRYISGLEFFSVVLGDEPALSPQQEFYHRLLANDGVTVVETLEEGLKEYKSAQLADNLVMPALALAAYDHRLGRLDTDQIDRIQAAMLEIRAVFDNAKDKKAETVATADIIVIPARGMIDTEAARFFAAVLHREHACRVSAITKSTGLTALASAQSTYQDAEIRAVVIITVGGMDRSQLEFVTKRAVRDFPRAAIIVVGMSSPQHRNRFSAMPPVARTVSLTSVTEAALRLTCAPSPETSPEQLASTDAELQQLASGAAA